jgi:BlaI family transcriptional regulator, penicillinase repressor
MARPKYPQPTPAELEALHVLWDKGPSTVREVMDVLEDTRPRAYTSVMSLLSVMAEKGLCDRDLRGRAFVYKPKLDRGQTQGGLLGDIVKRAFNGSPSTLVAQLLEQTRPSPTEVDQIKKVVSEYDKKHKK